MPIPKEILAVERPSNTVVQAYGKNKDRYAVKQRIGCRRVGGRNVPVNGPTIGHIVDGAYVPMKRLTSDAADLKDWANVVYCDSLFRDIIDELSLQYDRADAVRIYVISVLRVCYPGIRDRELKDRYEESFLSESYPGVALSRNTVSEFMERLGKNISRIVSFMRKRAESASMDHHLIVDGALKSDESSVNSLPDFSRKARTKGSRDISVIYAFDLEKKEPVCSQCYPGNMLDVAAYSDFVEKCGIKKGIIVADKGFPSSSAAKSFQENPQLHYLNPVKRNSKLAERHSMYEYEGVLKAHDGILYRKAAVEGGKKYLYSFRDQRRAAKEEADFIRHSAEDYDDARFKEKQARFGTVVLECDLDMEPSEIYEAYSKRWEIEMVMRYYKQACEFDETRVHSDYSVYGSEFVSFLSSLLTYRILNDSEKRKVLEEYSYGQMMERLRRAKKIRVDKEGFRLIRVNPSTEKLLSDLGIVEKEQPAKRKRGRPRKNSI